ncbi:MAG: helix-turn-helix domain-containing protein, partial [Ilumatobacteraceae bacterium]
MSTGGGVVRRMRGIAGISQGELARRAGIAQSAISDYERGVKVPSVPTLERLAHAADMS